MKEVPSLARAAGEQCTEGHVDRGKPWIVNRGWEALSQQLPAVLRGACCPVPTSPELRPPPLSCHPSPELRALPEQRIAFRLGSGGRGEGWEATVSLTPGLSPLPLGGLYSH